MAPSLDPLEKEYLVDPPRWPPFQKKVYGYHPLLNGKLVGDDENDNQGPTPP